MAERIPSDIVGVEREQLSSSLDRLEALPMVKSARCDPSDRRVVCNMWCGAQHPPGKLKQPRVKLNAKPLTDPTAVPTFLVAAEKLLLDISKEHDGCLQAAEAAKANARAAAHGQQSGARQPALHMHCPAGD